jgi:DNA polymerase III epsilon subunit-like protein
MKEFIQNLIYIGYNWVRNIFIPDKNTQPLITESAITDTSLLLPTKEEEDEEEEIVLNSPKLSINVPAPRYYMFLDTETTGIPIQKSYDKYFEPHMISFYNSARMIELGYLITDDVGNIIKEQSFLIKPNGFLIKNSNIHGITTEKAANEGVDVRHALDTLFADLQTVEQLICHNTNFDKHILLSECYREYKNEVDIIKIIKKIKKECTMEIGKARFNLIKPPKLVELYKQIFDQEPKQEHRALSDVYLCYDCYFNINKRNK